MGARASLYTIGYEGRTLRRLVNELKRNNIEVLVDVRERAASRIKGFSAMALFEGLRKAGVDYQHVRELGNPIEIRQEFHTGDLEKARKRYRRLLLDGRSPAVDELVRVARKRRTAILCRERDAADCHRSVIAEEAASRGPLSIVHL